MLHDIAIGIGFACAILGFLVFGFWISYYVRAKGTTWDKLFAVFKDSATILVARLSAMSGLILGAVITLSSDPSIQEYIRTMLRPEFVPFYLIALSLLVEIGRRRTLDS